MSDLPTPTQITDLAALLAPGLIIASIRARAITGSLPDLKDRVFAYGVISAGYFAAITPLFHVGWGLSVPVWAWKLLQYFLLPVILGLAGAVAYQHQLSYRLAALIRLHLAHHIHASWDFAFERRDPDQFILVTMKDGSQVAGRWAVGSFASSSKEERDLLIAEMWEVGSGGPWTVISPPRSILIAGSEIRYIEFL